MGPNPTAGRDETHTTTVATRIVTSPPGLPHGCRSHRHRMLISGPLRRVVIRTPGQTNLHTSESHSYTAARHQSSTLCLNIRSSTMDTPWSPVSGRTISREISLDVSSTSWHPTRRRQTPFERPATDSKSVPALSSLCSLLHQRGSKDRRCSHQNVHPACPISIEVVCTRQHHDSHVFAIWRNATQHEAGDPKERDGQQMGGLDGPRLLSVGRCDDKIG
jgi:hypothetical protein